MDAERRPPDGKRTASVRLYVALCQAGERQDDCWVAVRDELDAVGRAGPVRERVHDSAVPAMLHQVVTALDVVRSVDRGERLERHLQLPGSGRWRGVYR